MKDPNLYTDEFILSLLDANEKRAISILYNLYSEQAYQTALSIVEDEVVASEIVQDLLINIWEKRHSLNLKSPLKPYLSKAITHRCFNYLRNRKTRRKTLIVDLTLLETMSINPEAEAKLDAKDIRDLIRRTKVFLPPRTRIVFILNRSFRMSYKEVASYMGISIKGVEKHMSKALTLFRKALSEYLRSLITTLL